MQGLKTKRLVLSALFLAVGMVLPFLTGQIKEIGDSLLPMHLAVMLCGLICGPKYGATVGLILPFLRSLCFGMPPLYPNAIWMAFELSTYALVIGVLYQMVKNKHIGYLYMCLGVSMVSGRIVWGATKAILLGIANTPITMKALIIGGVVDAIPGIILQLVLIPMIMHLIRKKENKMVKISFPYGKGKIEHSFNENELLAVLDSSINEYDPKCNEIDLVKRAMENPEGKSLKELARGKENVVIIASDHTRPVPSKIIMPLMLEEIRSVAPNAKITILIATGCHRGTTRDELVSKFGSEIVENENIYIHDCDEREMLVNIGTLPSGGMCEINKIAYDADLLVAEGFIEPHFFAGFSGGRKSVLPGICARGTVLANHCSEFIANPSCRTGILENNPMHEDMLWAAKKAKLAYIVNVVLNADKKIIFATAGDSERAHKKGTDFISSLCGVTSKEADVVITTNGGYPLDQNAYQAVKGMTAAEATVKKDGVIIMLADSSDGVGGNHFYKQLSEESDINKTMESFLARSRGETVPDQWQTQVLLRVLMHARVIYISELDDKTVESLHLIPAHSIDEALLKAKKMLNKNNIKIVAIPDGVSVIVKGE